MPKYGIQKAANSVKNFFWSVVVLAIVIFAIVFIVKKVTPGLKLTGETMNANYGEQKQ